MNATVLIFTAAVATVTGLTFGLAPALSLSHPHPATINPSGPAAEIVHGTSNSHYLLIVVQVALTLVLLAGTGATLRGLLINPLYRIHHTD